MIRIGRFGDVPVIPLPLQSRIPDYMDLLKKSVVVLDNISDRLFATEIAETIDVTQLSQQVWKAAQVNVKLVQSSQSVTCHFSPPSTASGISGGWIRDSSWSFEGYDSDDHHYPSRTRIAMPGRRNSIITHLCVRLGFLHVLTLCGFSDVYYSDLSKISATITMVSSTKSDATIHCTVSTDQDPMIFQARVA